MKAPERIEKMLTEYGALEAAGKQRPLTPAEVQRLELLKDVLLEVEALQESEEEHRPARHPRAPVALEVSFGTPGDAARAYTRDIGTGGLAIATDRVLPTGSIVQLQVRVPGWQQPLSADAEVIWCRDGALGLSFTALRPEEQRRVRQLLVDNTPLLSRLRSAVTKAPPSKPVAARVTGGDPIALRLADAVLADVCAELLGLEGFVVYDAVPEGVIPAVLVADPPHLAEAADLFPGIPLVAVNASGPETLVGRLSRLRPLAWVRRPASAAKVLEGVRAALAGAASMRAARRPT